MPDNIQGQGAPLSSTVGEIGCVYTDTNTGRQYKCVSVHKYTTMKHPLLSYIWRALKKASGGNSDEPNGKPIVVATSADMDAILANATDEDVGEFYLYQGETTETYTNGAVYSIQKEDS